MKTMYLFIVFMNLIPHQTYCFDPVEKISYAASVIKNAVTSDTAILIYTGIAVQTSAFVTTNLLSPFLYKVRLMLNAESAAELQARTQLQKQLNELEQAHFQFELAKFIALQQEFEKYEEILQEKIEHIREKQKYNEEQKQKKIQEKLDRIAKTKKALESQRISQLEKILKAKS